MCTGYVDGQRRGARPHPGSPPPTRRWCSPVYETLDGWQESTRGARSWAELPATAVKYIRRIEELIEAPVAMLSTSPERDDTILVRDPFAGLMHLSRTCARRRIGACSPWPHHSLWSSCPDLFRASISTRCGGETWMAGTPPDLFRGAGHDRHSSAISGGGNRLVSAPLSRAGAPRRPGRAGRWAWASRRGIASSIAAAARSTAASRRAEGPGSAGRPAALTR